MRRLDIGGGRSHLIYIYSHLQQQGATSPGNASVAATQISSHVQDVSELKAVTANRRYTDDTLRGLRDTVRQVVASDSLDYLAAVTEGMLNA